MRPKAAYSMTASVSGMASSSRMRPGFSDHPPDVVRRDRRDGSHAFIYSLSSRPVSLMNRLSRLGCRMATSRTVPSVAGDRQQPGQLLLGVLHGEQQLGVRDLEELELRVRRRSPASPHRRVNDRAAR